MLDEDLRIYGQADVDNLLDVRESSVQLEISHFATGNEDALDDIDDEDD